MIYHAWKQLIRNQMTTYNFVCFLRAAWGMTEKQYVIMTNDDSGVSPVSMLSLTMQVPLRRTASHCMVQPWAGITTTSPGTKQALSTCTDPEPATRTSARSAECTVLWRLCWLCENQVQYSISNIPVPLETSMNSSYCFELHYNI